MQAVREFADGDGYAACAEVVASEDQLRSLGIAEEPLQLSFFRRVSLLDFRAACFE